MHLPSRGLRLSATTMRKAGVFLAPMRFIRILTDINSVRLRLYSSGSQHGQHGKCHRLLKKSREGMPAAKSLASPVFELFSEKTVFAHREVERPKSPVVDFQPLTNTDPSLTRQKIMREYPRKAGKQHHRPTERSVGPNAPRR